MNVLNVLKTASLYLNISDILQPIFNEENNISSESGNAYTKLLEAFNNVVGVLSSNYFDIYSASVINLDNNFEFDLSTLSFRCKKVVSLTSGGKSLKFKVAGNTLTTTQSGVATLTYAYIPDAYEDDDEMDILPMIDLSTLAMGVAYEYSYMQAIYDDAQMWKERFEESITRIKSSLLQNKNTPARSWF